MKTAVTQTSLMSYFQDIKDNKELTQGQKVLKVIEKLKGKASINQIARDLGIYPGTVSARLNDLKSKGLVEKTSELIRDKVTGKSNELWRAL